MNGVRQLTVARRQLALFGGPEVAAVPQADRLPQVRRLVLAVRDGIHHPATLLEFLAVDQRHFSYYRQACELLRLIVIKPDRTLALTATGLRLLATAEGSEAERAVFRRAIEQGPLAYLAPLFRGFEPTAEACAEQILSTCNLAPSTALRRARTLLLWRRYLDGKTPRPATKLELPNLTPRLTKLIAHHNALAKQTALEWLCAIDPTAFEHLTGELMQAMGYLDVTVKGGSGDGGVDVEAVRIDQWEHRSSVAVQVKRYQRPIGRRIVDELIGVLARRRYSVGILVTTSDFSHQAQKAAQDEPRLQLVNGPQFVELLARHGVVVTYGRHGELVPIKNGSHPPVPTDLRN